MEVGALGGVYGEVGQEGQLSLVRYHRLLHHPRWCLWGACSGGSKWGERASFRNGISTGGPGRCGRYWWQPGVGGLWRQGAWSGLSLVRRKLESMNGGM